MSIEINGILYFTQNWYHETYAVLLIKKQIFQMKMLNVITPKCRCYLLFLKVDYCPVVAVQKWIGGGSSSPLAL